MQCTTVREALSESAASTCVACTTLTNQAGWVYAGAADETSMELLALGKVLARSGREVGPTLPDRAGA